MYDIWFFFTIGYMIINVPNLVLKNVSSPSTSEFAVTLGPPVPGPVKGSFTLTDGVNPVIIDTVNTSNSEATYPVSAALKAGKTYTADINMPELNKN